MISPHSNNNFADPIPNLSETIVIQNRVVDRRFSPSVTTADVPLFYDSNAKPTRFGRNDSPLSFPLILGDIQERKFMGHVESQATGGFFVFGWYGMEERIMTRYARLMSSFVFVLSAFESFIRFLAGF